MTPWSVAHQAPLSMGFPRQEYGSGLPLPALRDPPNPGVKLESPALLVDSLPLTHLGSPKEHIDNPESPRLYHYWGQHDHWPIGYSPRYSSYSGMETWSYSTAALQVDQTLVNKTDKVHALMNLSLVEMTGIEQIITIVPGC